MSRLPDVLSGFIHMVWQELKFLTVYKNKVSYPIFIIIFGMSLYGVVIPDYGAQQTLSMEMPAGMSIGDSIFMDMLTFMFILVMKLEIIIPAELGITLITIISIMVGVNMMSRLAIRCAASSISRERQAKTLYIVTSTTNSRAAIYLAKLSGALLTTVPMILILLIGVFWASVSIFEITEVSGFKPELTGLVINIVIMALSTILLFTSLGMFMSVTKNSEELAVSISVKLMTIAATLAAIWMFLPSISMAGNEILSTVRTITMISPITQDLIALYEGNNVLVIQYALIQVFAALVLTTLGIILFNRQDIEY